MSQTWHVNSIRQLHDGSEDDFHSVVAVQRGENGFSWWLLLRGLILVAISILMVAYKIFFLLSGCLVWGLLIFGLVSLMSAFQREVLYEMVPVYSYGEYHTRPRMRARIGCSAQLLVLLVATVLYILVPALIK